MTKRMLAILTAALALLLLNGVAFAAKEGNIEFKSNAGSDYTMKVSVKLADGTKCNVDVSIVKDDTPKLKAEKVKAALDANCGGELATTIPVEGKVKTKDADGTVDVTEFTADIQNEADREWIAGLFPGERLNVALAFLGMTEPAPESLRVTANGTSFGTITNGRSPSELAAEIAGGLGNQGLSVTRVSNTIFLALIDSNGVEVKTDDSLLVVRATVALSENVPSLTTYGLIILALLLTGTAVWMFRKRRVGVA